MITQVESLDEVVLAEHLHGMGISATAAAAYATPLCEASRCTVTLYTFTANAACQSH